MKINLFYIISLILLISCKTTTESVKEISVAENLYLQAVSSSNTKQKINYLNDAVELNNSYYDALLERGKTYLMILEIDSAITDFESCIRLRPDSIESLKILGKTYTMIGEYSKAKEALNIALENTKDDVQLLEYLSDLYFSTNDYETSLKFIEEAIAIEDDTSYLYVNRGNIQWAMGQYENGIDSCNRALAINDNNVYALFIKGICYIYLESIDKAEVELRIAYKKGLPTVMKNKVRGFIEFEKGNYLKSAELYNNNFVLIDKAFNNKYISKYEYNRSLAGNYLMLSMIYFSYNDLEKSKEYYNKLILIDELYKKDTNEILKNEIFTVKEKYVFKQMYNAVLPKL